MNPASCHPHLERHCKGLCRSCYEKQLRETNKEFAERQRENRRNWGSKNPEKAKSSQAAARKKMNPDVRSVRAKYRRWAQRGLSPEQGQNLLDFQQNLCAICKGEFGPRGPDLDHNHETTLARGFLCPKCNKALGLLGDSAEILRTAALYLDNPPAERFLKNE